MKSRLYALGLAAFLTCWLPSAWAGTAEYRDGQMWDDDWMEEVTLRPPGTETGDAGDATSRRVSADNDDPDFDASADGAWRRVEIFRDPDMMGPDNSARWWAFFKSSEYDPGRLGAIVSLDYSVEGKQFQGGSGGTVGPALVQDGVLYLAAGTSMPEQDWTEKNFEDVVQSDFRDIDTLSQQPDFSVDGDPITFGLAYVVSTPSEQTVMRTVGFDNWRVTIESEEPLLINLGMNDAWLEKDNPGQGFFIVVLPDTGIVFIAWFTFDTERPAQGVLAIFGEPGHRWVTAQGPFTGSTAKLQVFLTEGGVLDMTDPPAVTDQDPIGTITIVWHDCHSATLTYEIDDPPVMGEIPLERASLPLDIVPLCEELRFFR